MSKTMDAILNLNLVPASVNRYLTLPDAAFVTRLNVALALLIASEAKAVYLGSAIFKLLASLSFFFGGLGRALHKSAPSDSVWPLLKEFIRGQLWKEDQYAFWMVLGLGFSVLGDVLLVPSREEYFKFMKKATSEKDDKKAAKAEGDTIYFKAGTFFFALAQISYTLAFFSAPTSRSAPWNWAYFGLASTFALGTSWALGILGGGNFVEIPKDTEPLVKLYVFIISGMVGVACATDNGWQRIIGAAMFMVSDLFVALDVFEKKDVQGDKVQARTSGRDGWMFRSIGWVLYFWAQMVLAGSI